MSVRHQQAQQAQQAQLAACRVWGLGFGVEGLGLRRSCERESISQRSTLAQPSQGTGMVRGWVGVDGGILVWVDRWTRGVGEGDRNSLAETWESRT